ncbi:MAG: ABC transporter ATP-binding protein [Syntrophaceae bacterium]|nr:ABC transporter ATP-binding protein [Syntrophaceae bacterium]
MTDNDKSPQIELKLEDIHKTYIMGEVKVPVLNGIDLDIYKGQFTAIVGDSGTGKSTLLNMIGGIDQPTSGRIFFEGNDIAGMNNRDLTMYRRKNVGFVFQFYNLVATLTSLENVEVSTEIADNPMDPTKALEMVELKDFASHFPAQMSGGQQQRVAIARALAKQPNLMLCDEPTGALDQQTSVTVLKTLYNLNQELNTTIIIITHNLNIAKMAHRVVRIGNGRIEKAYTNEHPLKAEEIAW